MESAANGLNNATTTTFTASEGPTYTYTLELVLDDYGSETTWSLRRFGEVLTKVALTPMAPMVNWFPPNSV